MDIVISTFRKLLDCISLSNGSVISLEWRYSKYLFFSIQFCCKIYTPKLTRDLSWCIVHRLIDGRWAVSCDEQRSLKMRKNEMTGLPTYYNVSNVEESSATRLWSILESIHLRGRWRIWRQRKVNENEENEQMSVVCCMFRLSTKNSRKSRLERNLMRHYMDSLRLDTSILRIL